MSRIVFFLLFAGCLCSSSFAQESMIQRVHLAVQKHNQFSVFAEGGCTFPYTDVQKPQTGVVVGVSGFYSPLSYLQIGVNVQKGYLREGRAQKPFGPMHYHNWFYTATVVSRLSPLRIFKRPEEGFVRFLDAYVGLGFGVISSSVHSGFVQEAKYGYVKDYSGTDLIIPYEIGYTLPVYSFGKQQYELSLNVNYRQHFVTSDKLDGYEPTVEANKRNDTFNQLTFGLAFSF